MNFYNKRNTEVVFQYFLIDAKRQESIIQFERQKGLLWVINHYRLQVLVALVFNALYQLSGINIIVLYSSLIYTRLQITKIYLANLLFGMSQMFGAVFTYVMIYFFSKKVIISLGFFFCSIGILVGVIAISETVKWLFLIGSYIYIFSFAFSIGPLIVVYLTYFIPPRLLSYFSAIQWFLAAVIAFFSIDLLTDVDIILISEILIAFNMFGLIFFAGYAINTKGKTFDDVKKEFEQKKFLE